MALTPGRLHTREDSGLELDRDLTWRHDGEPLTHPNIIEAFNRGLSVRDDGQYVLTFGNDWALVKVADCGFGVVAVDEGEGGRLSVRLTDRTAEWLDAGSLALDDEGVLTVRVKGAKAKARFSRDAQFALAQWLVPEGARLVLQVGGSRWPTPLPSDG